MFKSFLSLLLILLVSTVYAQEECAQGFEFSNSLNRCILKEQTVSTKTQASRCEQLQGQAKSDCYEENINSQTEAKTKDAEAKYGVPLIMSLSLGYVLFTNKAQVKECGAASLWTMFLASSGVILGEYLANKKYEDKLDDMAKEYRAEVESTSTESDADKETKVTNSTQNQLRAFDYQIRQEEYKAEAHGQRKKIYNVASGLYALATVIALYEAYADYKDKANDCKIGNYTSSTTLFKLPFLNGTPLEGYAYLEKISFEELQEIILRKFNFFPSAHAADGKFAFLTKIKDGVGKGTEKVASFLRNAYVRAVLGGLMTTYSLDVADDAKEYESQAKSRARTLRDLRNGFEVSGGAGFSFCTTEDRSNPQKAQCYCYLENGQRRPGRENSTVCAAVFGSDLDLEATNYNKNNEFAFTPIKGCFTKDGKIDEDCDECKEQKDKDGDDNCFSVSGNINLGAVGANPIATDLLRTGAGFTNGNISTADFSGADARRFAASLDSLKDQIVKNNPKAKKDLKKIKDNQNKLRRSFLNLTKNSSRGNPRKILSGLSSLGTGTGSSSKAIDKINKDAKDILPKEAFNSGGTIAGNNGTDENDYDFGLNDAKGGIIIEDEVADMEKEYKIDDINSNSYQDIFKIITNRYLRSGYKRLFDDKAYTITDQPAESEIHEQ